MADVNCIKFEMRHKVQKIANFYKQNRVRFSWNRIRKNCSEEMYFLIFEENKMYEDFATSSWSQYIVVGGFHPEISRPGFKELSRKKQDSIRGFVPDFPDFTRQHNPIKRAYSIVAKLCDDFDAKLASGDEFDPVPLLLQIDKYSSFVNTLLDFTTIVHKVNKNGFYSDQGPAEVFSTIERLLRKSPIDMRDSIPGLFAYLTWESIDDFAHSVDIEAFFVFLETQQVYQIHFADLGDDKTRQKEDDIRTAAHHIMYSIILKLDDVVKMAYEALEESYPGARIAVGDLFAKYVEK